MEKEKKVNESTPKKEEAKLTYEQLRAYAEQITAQAKKIYQENQVLRQTLQKERMDRLYKEIELMLKCLDHAEMFSTEFITLTTKRLEEILTPAEPKDETEEEEKEE